MNNHIKAQILLLCFCQLIIIAAMEMSNPFLPIYLQSLGDFDLLPVNAWNVLAYAMPLISAMLFSPFWGKYADRFGYKTMILRAALALAIIQLLIYLTNSALLFITLRFIQGAIAGFLLAAQSYAVVIVSKEFRSRILAWLQSSTAIGIAIGPLIGGVLATLLSYNQIFLICAVIACCIFIILLIKLESISNPSLLSKQDNNKNCYHKNTSNNYLIYVYFSVIFLAILLSQTAKFLPQSFFAIYAKEFF
ncbi:reduced folate carrier family protein [Francisella tularensis]|nr:reduced folate carrier family protein [Francisella tularensis]